jgi:hypothetical protein
MKFFVVTAAFLLCNGISLLAGQSSGSGSQATSDTAKPTTQSSGTSAQTTTEKAKTKPRKVWTNDEISNVGGDRAISVVGKAGGDSNPPSDIFQKTAPGPGARDKQAATYRERLHQLNNEMEATDKKISQLRNFKADNTSASGGINMNHGYSMTPVEDQVKQLEEKKKQIQAQIDAVEDQARKNGFEPGQLR